MTSTEGQHTCAGISLKDLLTVTELRGTNWLFKWAKCPRPSGSYRRMLKPPLSQHVLLFFLQVMFELHCMEWRMCWEYTFKYMSLYVTVSTVWMNGCDSKCVKTKAAKMWNRLPTASLLEVPVQTDGSSDSAVICPATSRMVWHNCTQHVRVPHRSTKMSWFHWSLLNSVGVCLTICQQEEACVHSVLVSARSRCSLVSMKP